MYDEVKLMHLKIVICLKISLDKKVNKFHETLAVNSFGNLWVKNKDVKKVQNNDMPINYWYRFPTMLFTENCSFISNLDDCGYNILRVTTISTQSHTKSSSLHECLNKSVSCNLREHKRGE